MDLIIFFAAAVVAIVGLYLKIRSSGKFADAMLEKARQIGVRRAHITPLIPKYQIALAFIAFAIIALELMYILLGFPLPKMEVRAVLVVAGTTSLAYLVWYSFRWRA